MITHDRELAASLPRQVQMLDGQIVADNAETAERRGDERDREAAAPRSRSARSGWC